MSVVLLPVSSNCQSSPLVGICSTPAHMIMNSGSLQQSCPDELSPSIPVLNDLKNGLPPSQKPQMHLFIINSTRWDSLTSTTIKLHIYELTFLKIPLNFQILKITYLQCVKFSVWWEVYFLPRGFEWVCINLVTVRSKKCTSGCFFFFILFFRADGNECFVFLACLFFFFINWTVLSKSCLAQNTMFSSQTSWAVTIIS